MLLPCYQECCYPKVLGCSLIALLGRNVLGVFVEKILSGLDIILKGYLMVQRVVKTLNIVCSFIESNLCLWRHCNFTSISFLIIQALLLIVLFSFYMFSHISRHCDGVGYMVMEIKLVKKSFFFFHSLVFYLLNL